MNLVGDAFRLTGDGWGHSSQRGYSAACIDVSLEFTFLGGQEGTIMYDRHDIGPELQISQAARRILGEAKPWT